jgi:hypothetical protein
MSNRNVILSCGHYEIEGNDAFGHHIHALDYDDLGKDCITSQCVCTPCLSWFQENFILFPSLEEGIEYIAKQK